MAGVLEGQAVEQRTEADRVRLEVLACVWLSEHLDRLVEPDPAARIRERLVERWNLLDQDASPEERGALLDAFSEVSSAAEQGALERDALRQHGTSRAALAAHEWLLVASNTQRRSRRGVYTTPDALADFLVERTDRQLLEMLGLPLGLADRSTWAEVSERSGLAIPSGVAPDERFVRVLDPATGSGVFPLAVARRARQNQLADFEAAGRTAQEADAHWAKELAPDLASALVLHELLPVPRALARWHLAEVFGDAVPTIHPANPLANHEALPFPTTVTLGNPPYSVRAGSLDDRSRALVEPYRSADGERIAEKGALRFEMHLQDDYVKFIRLAELQVERAGAGVVALVTNSSYLDSPSLRGLRASVTKTFQRVELTDLHGGRTRATEELRAAGDQSVFGIGQGVSTLVACSSGVGGASARVCFGELIGPREDKLAELASAAAGRQLSTVRLEPAAPSWILRPRETRHAAEYERWIGLRELFQGSISGIVTAHDRLVVAFDDATLLEKARLICDERLGLDELRAALGVRDNAGWKLERARDRFRADPDRELCLRDYAYRPFDTRRLLYHPALVWCDRRKLMSSLGEPSNVALAVCRQLAAPPWRHVFATRQLVDDNLVSNRSRERSHTFPLYRRLEPGDTSSPLASNLDPAAVRALAPDDRRVSPEEVLAYVYAVLHSPSYRLRHRDSLSLDFPRVPACKDAELFRRLAECGEQLLEAHLSPCNDLGRAPVAQLRTEGTGAPIVARGFPKYADGRVFLNADYTLERISEGAWSYTVGSYQPCRKWLKDRVGRSLSGTELAAFSRLVDGVEASLAALRRLSELPLETTLRTPTSASSQF